MVEREIQRVLDAIPNQRDEDPFAWYRTCTPPEEKLRRLQDCRRLNELPPREIWESHDRLRRG